MSICLARNLSVNERQSSLSSIYSSMESLSNSHGAESYRLVTQVPTSTAYTIPRLRTKTSDYDTGFSAAEHDEEKKLTKKVGRVRKAFSFNRSSKLKKTSSIDKETPPHGPDAAAELMARLTLLEDQVRTMGEELHKERVHREELEQKVDNLQSENEELKSERKVAGDQLQKFYKKFFDSVHSIPSQLMHNGLSTSTLNRSTLSMRRSGISINSMTSQ